ncbi:superoxide dismutase family protein [Haliangium ochraceum]|uniref:Superoxide dismutase [Cu-Zn] n=1 Tax=Haliangium ochraceum (strain DSM 14365 / JCM 11303 / SMP-2) TaxID=502025 RepID=D0LRE4_HALO1|nr:superoxide dismutase family protein [Haliangium ochraceum]ACY17172.1 Superoxide dismutase [Haliangium ochraceum DSM 14365]
MSLRILALICATALGLSASCKSEETTAPEAELAKVDPAVEPEAAEPEAAEAEAAEPEEMDALMARAKLQSVEGQSIEGEVSFKEAGDGIEIHLNVQGLEAGKHGFHIHETGDCSAPDFKSAGGHFNPAQHDHGEPGPSSHAGDLGNIEVGADGTSEATMTSTDIILREGANSVVGKAVVIHAGADDLKSQPSGDAGGRVACGVIELDS